MKKMLSLVLVFVVVVMFCGCSMNQEEREQYIESQKVTYGFRNLVDIADSTTSLHLVYDDETMIVYYWMEYSYTKSAASCMSPYYSENGYLCRYNPDTGELEEIIH